MFSRKGAGKSKKGFGKDAPVDEEEIFRQEVRNSLPEAALARMLPQLFADDWTVPIRSPLGISSSDGIAIVSKARVANVIRQVGYTRNSVGIITTQSASQLYLKGYPCQEMFIRIKVRTEDDEDKGLYVRRYIPHTIMMWKTCAAENYWRTSDHPRDYDQNGCKTTSLLWMDQRSYERKHPL